MQNVTKALLLGAAAFLAISGTREATVATTPGPLYAADGRMLRPAGYREWTFVTSGFDMSYNAGMQMDTHTFDNVFVNPSAYSTFVETGRWPDKTVLVLEHRDGRQKGSINQGGSFQTDLSDIEVHVKDEARFPGKWAFFGFSATDATGTLIPRPASCYTCHSAHAAVDTTFVQFYTTLLPIAKLKGTLDTVDQP